MPRCGPAVLALYSMSRGLAGKPTGSHVVFSGLGNAICVCMLVSLRFFCHELNKRIPAEARSTRFLLTPGCYYKGGLGHSPHVVLCAVGLQEDFFSISQEQEDGDSRTERRQAHRAFAAGSGFSLHVAREGDRRSCIPTRDSPSSPAWTTSVAIVKALARSSHSPGARRIWPSTQRRRRSVYERPACERPNPFTRRPPAADELLRSQLSRSLQLLPPCAGNEAANLPCRAAANCATV